MENNIARFCVELLGLVQEQIKDLFRQYFVHLLRISEVVIVEYEFSSQFTCHILTQVFIRYIVFRMGLYACLLFKMCSAYPDFG